MDERADSQAPKDAPKEVVYRVRRFRPRRIGGRLADLSHPWAPGMTVLDGLGRSRKRWIRPSPSVLPAGWGVRSCGMLVNGLPRLACNTQIAELGSGMVTVAPLPNFDIVRDLVPDLGSMSTATGRSSPT